MADHGDRYGHEEKKVTECSVRSARTFLLERAHRVGVVYFVRGWRMLLSSHTSCGTLAPSLLLFPEWKSGRVVEH